VSDPIPPHVARGLDRIAEAMRAIDPDGTRSVCCFPFCGCGPDECYCEEEDDCDCPDCFDIV
jgi:hypothetical protein